MMKLSFAFILASTVALTQLSVNALPITTKYHMHGNSCQEISGSTGIERTKNGIRGFGPWVKVSCPIMIPNQQYTSISAKITAYYTYKYTSLGCELSKTSYDGTNYAYGTAWFTTVNTSVNQQKTITLPLNKNTVDDYFYLTCDLASNQNYINAIEITTIHE